MATGVPLDMFRYGLLCTKMAQDALLTPRFVMFASANNHIYSQNEEAISEIIRNFPMGKCSIVMNNLKTIFDLDPETDFELVGYSSHKNVKMEVAN
jgi:thymidylate synthase